MIETRFKDTEIGRIPEDWEIKDLRDSFEFLSNNTLSREKLGDDGRIRNIHYGDVLIAYGVHVDVERDFIPAIADANYCAKNFAKNGDIIIADTAEDETVGKAVEVVNIGETQIVSGLHTMWLHPKVEGLFYIGYLGYAFNASLFHNQLFPLMQGTKVTSVSKTAIKDTYITVPPKKEQSRIASALTSIDNLISSLDKLIEKKKNIKQGTMQQLLTGKKRLKGFSEPWMEKYLKDSFLIIVNNCCSREELSDTGKVLNVHYGDVLIKFGAVIDVKNNHLPYIVGKDVASRPLKDGDIIMADTAEDEACGKVCEIRGINDLQVESGLHTIALRPLDVYGERFLGYYMNSTAFHDLLLPLMQGTKVTSISKSALMNVGFSVPSSIEEQTAIASVLCSMDNEISAIEAKKAKYESIKQGMMQQLLTGRIRLVETAAKADTTTANRHFRRSVLAAEIADRLCEEPTFGHVKMEKMLFLVERLCHLDIGSQYHRDAAGPYDNRALFSIDSQLKSQKWFEAQKTAKGVRYIPMQKRGGHKSYFDRYYSDVLPIFDKVINTFRRQKTEQCEIVATLYSAWEDLLLGNKPCTDADIVDEVLNNWHESKKRIPPERWQRAIQWMRENDFAPKQADL